MVLTLHSSRQAYNLEMYGRSTEAGETEVPTASNHIGPGMRVEGPFLLAQLVFQEVEERRYHDEQRSGTDQCNTSATSLDTRYSSRRSFECIGRPSTMETRKSILIQKYKCQTQQMMPSGLEPWHLVPSMPEVGFCGEGGSLGKEGHRYEVIIPRYSCGFQNTRVCELIDQAHCEFLSSHPIGSLSFYQESHAIAGRSDDGQPYRWQPC